MDTFRSKIDLLVNKEACIKRLSYWAYANSESIQTNESIQTFMSQMQIPDGLAFLSQLVAYQDATIAIAINTKNFNEFSSPNLSRLVGTPQEIRVSIESFKQGKERAQAKQQIAYDALFSQAYLFDFEQKLNDSGLASTYPTAPAKKHLSTPTPKLYNPFHFLRETQQYPHARLKRSNLNERIYDTWNVIAGRVDPKWMTEGYSNDTSFRMVYRTINYATIVGLSGAPVAQSLGIVDYLSIGLFPLLHVVLKAANSYIKKHQLITRDEQFNKEKSPLSFKALSWFLTIFTGLINVIRLLIAAALTLLASPFVLMLHGGLSYFEPRPVRLRFYDDYANSDKIELNQRDKMAMVIAKVMNNFGTIADFECELRLTTRDDESDNSKTLKLSLEVEQFHSDKDTWEWKLDPNDLDDMSYLKELMEYNVFGITTDLERESTRYEYIQSCISSVDASNMISIRPVRRSTNNRVVFDR
ncbi:MAG: hypothetical protein Q8R24_02310 [Legionellaceae bacterium]|nr:hypothetical protein [Legionellaceae bacterium]